MLLSVCKRVDLSLLNNMVLCQVDPVDLYHPSNKGLPPLDADS